MIESLTPQTVLAEVMMVRAKFQGTILVTEGDSDHKFLRSFVSINECYLLPAHGKENAVGCITLLSSEIVEGVLAFVDSDHDRILKELPADENVVSTDYHDCEILMVTTEAFDKVVEEYSSSRKLSKFLQGQVGADFRTVLFRTCEPIGVLRLLSRRNNWNLCFRNIAFKKFIDGRTLALDRGSLVRCVLANTNGHAFKKSDILNILETEIGQSYYEVEQLCKGHDFTEIMGISLRQAVASLGLAMTSRENVEKLLRIAYHFELFRQTACFRDLVSWTRKNPRFQIFQEGCH